MTIYRFILRMVFLLLLSGCNMCSIPVTPAPPNPSDILREKAEYKMEESLLIEGGSGSGKIVSRKRILFNLISKDSIAGDDTLYYYRMAVKNWEDGEEDDPLFEKYFWARLSESSAEYKSTEQEMSPKLFLLKVTSQASEQDGFFKTLSSLLLGQPEWTENRGKFQFTRQITGRKAVKYKDRLEESWVVEEEISYDSHVFATGTFWYGASGLLKGRQVWEGLDKRNSLGGKEGSHQVIRNFQLQ
jgi:hypothetical protein